MPRSPQGRSRPPRRPGPLPSPTERATRALRELQQLAAELLDKQGLHPEDLDLTALSLRLQVPLDRAAAANDAAELVQQLAAGIETASKAQTSFCLGSVFCFLCASTDCVHARPQTPRETFLGYRPTGKPAWRAFTNLCIQREEPRVDRLFGEAPEIIALVQTHQELTDDLMPGFGRGSQVYNVLGQVVAGLIPLTLDPRDTDADRVVLTLQVVELGSGPSRRLRLNMIGLDLEAIAQTSTGSGPSESLRRTVRTTRERLSGLERRSASDKTALDHAQREERHAQREERHAQREERHAQLEERHAQLEERVGHLLTQLRGDVERVFRPIRHRTRHAQERHEGGSRPTSKAVSDALEASNERFLQDTARGTIVVLGPRSRAHVFAPSGRHVTSLQLRPREVDRKVDRKRWCPLPQDELAGFRETLSRRHQPPQ